MNSPTVRRTAAAFAAFAVTGLIAMPLAACSGGVDYDAERARVESQHSSYMRGKPSPTRVTGPAPYTPPTTATSSATAQQPDKKSGGIPVWVWILGGGAVLFVGYRFLQGGGGQPPAHATYGAGSVPQQVLDYPAFDEDDWDDEEPVAPVTPPAPPAATGGSAGPAPTPPTGSSTTNDLWGA